MPPKGPQGQVTGTSTKRKGALSTPINEDIDWQKDVEENGSTDTIGGDNALRGLLAKELESAQSAVRYFSLDWDEYEDLLFVQSRTADNSHVRVSGGDLSSIVIERAGRVMSNQPVGTVHANGIQNMGKGMLMNLVLDKYIYPNANYQNDLDTKLFMWDMYSNVYGAMVMCYDWFETENYVGPDCWLVPIRSFFPQQGRSSIESCDYVFISNNISREELLSIVEDEVPNYDLEAINQVLEKTAHGSVKPKSRDDYLRNNPMWEWRRRAPWTDTGDIEVVTKYEAGPQGRWIDFCPDFDNIVIRNIPNPHKNGRIPAVLKPGLPTLDSIIGRGDMEAGRFQQYALDTTLNLQIDRLRLATYPPIKVVNGNVVMPSIRFQPGAKWLVSNPNDVSHHQFPDVQENMNQSYQFLKAALNNTLGNTTTQVSAENTDTTQGKTPQAIKSMNMSQSTRDAIDTKLMGKAIEKLFNGMIGLINDVAWNKPIEFYQFGQDIAQIASMYPDVRDCISFEGKNSGKDVKDASAVKITLKPSRIKNEKGYIYKIDPMSTQAQDKDKEHATLLQVWSEVIPNFETIQTMLQTQGQMFDFADFLKKVMQTGGLRDVSSIIKPVVQNGNMGASQQSQQPSGGSSGGSKVFEDINIKDLPPAGAAQLAQMGGINLSPQDFEQNADAEAQRKTQNQIALKQATQQEKQPQQTPISLPVGPDYQQARAHITAVHNQLHKTISDDIAQGRT